MGFLYLPVNFNYKGIKVGAAISLEPPTVRSERVATSRVKHLWNPVRAPPTSNGSWLNRFFLINLPRINCKTLSSVHTRPPPSVPLLVISQRTLNNQGRSPKWASLLERVVWRIHYRDCAFDSNTTLTIKKRTALKSFFFSFSLKASRPSQPLHER